ncbi:O-acyltransferase [Balamuthia mandrillaris]
MRALLRAHKMELFSSTEVDSTALSYPQVRQRSNIRKCKSSADLQEVEQEHAEAAQEPEEKKGEDVTRGHSFVVHKRCVPSLLSPESESQNYRGLFNLAGLVLFVTNFRLVVENLLKYGLLINFNGSIRDNLKLRSALLIACGLLYFTLFTLVVELLAARSVRKYREKQRNRPKGTPKKRPDEVIPLNAYYNAQLINITLLLVVCMVMCLYTDPISAAALMGLMLVLLMKLISYVMVNRELRQAVLFPNSDNFVVHKDKHSRYPENVSLSNLMYFLAAPTLCYQPHYPRTSKIRWLYVGSLFARLVFCLSLMAFMLEQYVVPTVLNSLEPLDSMHFGRLLERLLKLSIPNLYIWLLMFYSFFHLWLNILAELLRFGDREFYKDWWNSTTLSEYWRTWNIPVHTWMIRHAYYPLRRKGWSRSVAALFIFFLSGVGHEVMVSVPCRSFQLWVFASFMMQIPLIWATRTFMKGTKWGNLVFWFSFCMLGQPLCILLYTHLAVNHYSFLLFRTGP